MARTRGNAELIAALRAKIETLQEVLALLEKQAAAPAKRPAKAKEEKQS